MKRLLFSVFAFLFFIPALIAQSNRSSIRIRLSDGDLIKIAVNNRYFEKTGRSLTIGDLHGRRQYLKVYRFRPYADGRGGKAELVFRGTIKIEKGTAYDAVVDVQSRKLQLSDISVMPAQAALPSINSRPDQPLNSGEYIPEEQQETVYNPLPEHLQSLKIAMDAQITDAGKLKEAKNYLRQNLSAQDAAIISEWFFFDDTRMDFVKAAYPKITDKNNAGLLRETFTGESAKQEFNKLFPRK